MEKKDFELLKVIIYDIEAMMDCRNEEKDFFYHYELAKGNVKDLIKKEEGDD